MDLDLQYLLQRQEQQFRALEHQNHVLMSELIALKSLLVLYVHQSGKFPQTPEELREELSKQSKAVLARLSEFPSATQWPAYPPEDTFGK